MADDPGKRDFRDRSRVSAEQEHEVRYFAEQAQITVAQARELIRKHGNDRETLMLEAKRLAS
ncbi:DUF3606 domain-containing protein [Mesorhizobium yinganensis]|uniref:DUF3606 domain-containing protein n=1 Tax=Mesorhizobium yinganensis TaxID=3157707 RepID=UPI0032B84071